MHKKFTILLILSLLFLTGCAISSQKEQTIDEDQNFEELFADIEREKEEELKLICDKEMIPAKYASDCYFRELKSCESTSGEMIPKSELEKCASVFLKEAENPSWLYD